MTTGVKRDDVILFERSIYSLVPHKLAWTKTPQTSLAPCNGQRSHSQHIACNSPQPRYRGWTAVDFGLSERFPRLEGYEQQLVPCTLAL